MKSGKLVITVGAFLTGLIAAMFMALGMLVEAFPKDMGILSTLGPFPGSVVGSATPNTILLFGLSAVVVMLAAAVIGVFSTKPANYSAAALGFSVAILSIFLLDWGLFVGFFAALLFSVLEWLDS
jgi:hypothetical protein